MRATILDTQTGETLTVDAPRSWEWAENNWSCDCNRSEYFGVYGDDSQCDGCERFLVVAAEFDPGDYHYTLEELNEGYPAELKRRFLPKTLSEKIAQVLEKAYADGTLKPLTKEEFEQACREEYGMGEAPLFFPPRNEK